MIVDGFEPTSQMTSSFELDSSTTEDNTIKQLTTTTGFEPVRAKPNALAMHPNKPLWHVVNYRLHGELNPDLKDQNLVFYH